ncbi:hypothetical protein Taro_047359 [Colocasia esculenta]|uniref:Uncharacterized protein n=1 Tax=Colocasia esculenta TaxID=4460 RepID=A0A843X0U4_COLES|nr:hypothetical protein [Colocasia esculenta]
MSDAKEIRQLHETDELKKYIEGVPPVDLDVCEIYCGGFRFLLCDKCSGDQDGLDLFKHINGGVVELCVGDKM